ncbi:hypothetical protein HQ545_01045, partial [Candidatus Woesearchaeota archaeon]|nr:hypothetical protein [Candidatus Woesearchaeota archaeon]
MLGTKAQGMSLKVIVAAVLGIAILVVLIMMFAGKIRLFGGTLSSCEAKGPGAHCIANADNSGTCDGPIHRVGTDCLTREPSPGPWCCVPITG